MSGLATFFPFIIFLIITQGVRYSIIDRLCLMADRRAREDSWEKEGDAILLLSVERY